MTKIMLVEDDKSLREIYGVRLLAEGYDIVSAGDGEEALAMAIKERPQLIVSDVMMPKISGFDMLDILRSTTETRDIRVIMMTALSSEEQRQRGEALGADRYLVKSQVGIEDVVRVVHEVLGDTAAASQPLEASQPVAPVPTAAAPAAPPVTTTPIQPVAPTSPLSAAPSVAPTATAHPVIPPTPVAPPPPAPEPPRPASLTNRVIQPITDPNVPPVDLGALLDKELAKEAGIGDDERPTVQSMAEEKDLVATQISSFNPDAITINEDGSVTDPTEATALATPTALPTPSAPPTPPPTSDSALPPPPPPPVTA